MCDAVGLSHLLGGLCRSGPFSRLDCSVLPVSVTDHRQQCLFCWRLSSGRQLQRADVHVITLSCENQIFVVFVRCMSVEHLAVLVTQQRRVDCARILLPSFQVLPSGKWTLGAYPAPMQQRTPVRDIRILVDNTSMGGPINGIVAHSGPKCIRYRDHGGLGARSCVVIVIALAAGNTRASSDSNFHPSAAPHLCDRSGDSVGVSVEALMLGMRRNRDKKLSCRCDSWLLADPAAYDVRYTDKLSNRFRLQVYERLVRTIRFNGWSLWTHPNSIYSSVTIERNRRKFAEFTKSVNNRM